MLCENIQNPENLIIPYEKKKQNENHENRKILRENNENNEITIFTLENQ